MTRLTAWRMGGVVLILCAATAIGASAQNFNVLQSFDKRNGAIPQAALVQATDGNFYGTTLEGGDLTCSAPNGCGTVFKITPMGVLTTVHRFTSSGGSYPFGGLVQATDGSLYGTTVAGGSSPNCDGGCGTIFKITPHGELTTLYSFDSTDGAAPLWLVTTP
jgi:uncharacterized repeat protein (TIGR03803 family)